MNKKYFRILSLVFFIIGILSFLNLKINFTGAIIGTKIIHQGFSFIFGLIFISISILFFIRGKSDLESIVKDVEDLRGVREYKTLKEGISKSPEGQLFYASVYNKKNKRYDRVLFCHTSSKREASRIASRLDPVAQPIYQFMDQGLRKTLGKKGESVDRRELQKIASKYFIENPGADTRFKRRGFGSGEYDTSVGRGWMKKAYYDEPHEELGIPYPHYNIISNKLGYNIHCLIIPKKKKI